MKVAFVDMPKMRPEHVEVNITKIKYICCSLIPNLSILNRVFQTNFYIHFKILISKELFVINVFLVISRTPPPLQEF